MLPGPTVDLAARAALAAVQRADPVLPVGAICARTIALTKEPVLTPLPSLKPRPASAEAPARGLPAGAFRYKGFSVRERDGPIPYPGARPDKMQGAREAI